MVELWVPELPRPADLHHRPDTPASTLSRHAAVFSTQAWRWLAVGAFPLVHVLLTVYLYVPSWDSEYGYNHTLQRVALLDVPFTVQCDTRAAFRGTPQCSAASFIDRLLFGQVRARELV